MNTVTKYFHTRYRHILSRSLTALLLFIYMRCWVLPKGRPSSIVVIQNVQIGDMVCTTPLFHAIKQAFPETKLFVAGSKINKDVLEGNTDVDEYLVYTQSDPDMLSKLLAERHVQLGIVPSPSLESLLVLAHARIPHVIAGRLENGSSPYNTRLYRFLTFFVKTVPHRMGSYAPREYLKLIEPLGVQVDDITKHLAFSARAADMVRSVLAKAGIKDGDPFVIITTTAGNKVKEWPSERFAKVAEHIWKTYSLPIVVIGTAQDSEKVQTMLKSLQVVISMGAHIIDTSGRFSLDELKALIAKARLFIGVDTGPIYIAEAFNTPLIDIIGPMNEREQPPTGKDRLMVLPPGERVPQLHIMNARIYDEKEARRQVLSTTVEQVCEAVDTILSYEHSTPLR